MIVTTECQNPKENITPVADTSKVQAFSEGGHVRYDGTDSYDLMVIYHLTLGNRT